MMEWDCSLCSFIYKMNVKERVAAEKAKEIEKYNGKENIEFSNIKNKGNNVISISVISNEKRD